MRKTSIGTAFMILISATMIFAQDPDFGFKLGVNLASFTGNDANDIDRKAGFVSGLYFEKKMGGATNFRAEVFYSQKGNKETVTINYQDIDIQRKIDYLEIPLTLKFHPAEIRPLNVFVIGGLDAAFKLSGEASFIGDSVDSTSNIENLKTLDLGYVIGWGLFIVNGRHRTTMEMRFVQSLDSIYSNDQFLDIKSSTITFLVGSNFYLF